MEMLWLKVEDPFKTVVTCCIQPSNTLTPYNVPNKLYQANRRTTKAPDRVRESKRAIACQSPHLSSIEIILHVGEKLY